MEHESSDTSATSNSSPEEQKIFHPFTPNTPATIEAKIADELKKGTEGKTGIEEKNEDSRPDPSLKQGLRLPFRFWRILPMLLVNTLLQDIDPFYNNKRTFIIIDRRRNIFRFSATNALWILSPFNPVRRVAIHVLMHPLFTVFINATIIVNGVFMAIPTTPSVHPIKVICIGIYTLEIVVKVMARGFILQPFAYLRDAWNRLDFLVTVLAYTAMNVDLGNVVAFETLRMLHLLPIAALIPGLKVFEQIVIKSLKRLKEVIILTIFSLFVLGMMGLQFYMGVLRQKCVKNFPTDGPWGDFTPENWAKFANNETNWYFEEDKNEMALCGNSSGAKQCKSGYTCLPGYGGNPSYSYTNFDSFGWSLLSVFRLVTRDRWEGLYELVLNSAGSWHVIFFIIAIFFVSLNLMNLVLATVATCYEEVVKQIQEEEKYTEETTERDMQMQTDSEEEKKETPTKSAVDQNYWLTVQKFASSIIFHPFIQLFTTLCIVLNTIFLALYHHNMDVNLARILLNGSYLLTLIFGIEITMKIIALNPKSFFQKNWNTFDFMVVAFALLGLCFKDLQGISILRSLMLLKLIRLARYPLHNLNRHLSIMIISFSNAVKLTFVLCVVIFIFALLGMHLFGKNYLDNIDRFPGSELPRWNFTDLMHSFMLIFRVFCGEWVQSMWDCVLVDSVFTIPFFLVAVIVCRFVMANLYLVVIMSNVDRFLPINMGSDVDGILEAFSRIHLYVNRIKTEMFKKQISDELSNDTPKVEENIMEANEDKSEQDKTVEDADSNRDSDADDNCSKEQEPDENQSTDTKENTEIELTVPIGNKYWTYLRKKTFALVETKYFEGAVITVIIVSSLVLTLEDADLSKRQHLRQILQQMDTIFVDIFFGEMLMLWLGLGFKKYFTNPWYFLDFTVLTFLLTSYFSNIQLLKAVRILRVLRVLRPLLRFNSMKIILNTLKKAWSSLCCTLFLCLAVWLVFAILGVHLFAGKFFKCLDADKTVLSYETGSCKSKNYSWVNSQMNFDNVGNAYLSLFEVAMFKGWTQIIHDAVDSTFLKGVKGVYFVIFIIFGLFFTINMFTAVIIDIVNQRKWESTEELCWFRRDSWCKLDWKQFSTKEPLKTRSKPKWKRQLEVFEMVINKKFEMIMLIVSGLNVLIMATNHYQAKATFTAVLDYLNLTFMAIFSIECLLKMFALRHHYFKDPWNLFDLSLVMLSLFQLVISDIIGKYFILSTLRMIRVVKIKKYFRSMKWIKGIRILYFALSMSLPSLFCVCLVLFLVMFVYAIFGMFLFTHIDDENNNFQTFAQSMLFLFPLSTSAGWDVALDAITNQGNSIIATIYLLSYFLVCFLILSTYIGAIMSVYNHYIYIAEAGLIEDDFDEFFEIWQQFDPEATQFIPYNQLSDFFDKLEPPFQIRKPNKFKIISLDISIYRGDLIFYSDVLDALVHDILHGDYCWRQNQSNNRGDYVPVSSILMRQREIHCAKVIQNVWRKYKSSKGSKVDASGAVEPV